MKGVLIFKIQAYQKLEMRFTPYEYSWNFTSIFCKGIFTTIFLVFKIAEMGRIPLWYYSRLQKFIGILPRVYKSVCRYFISKPSIGYDQLFQCKSSNNHMWSSSVPKT
jgi:hypothetical protein